MPSSLLSNFFFLQMGKLRSRERQLVVEEGLEPRSPDSQDGQQHDAEKRGFRAREPWFCIPSLPMPSLLDLNQLFPFSDFPAGSDSEASACNAGDPGSIPGLGRSPGEGNGNPLQYCCLENPTDGGAWQALVHGVAESDRTEWLHSLTFPSLVQFPYS